MCLRCMLRCSRARLIAARSTRIEVTASRVTPARPPRASIRGSAPWVTATQQCCR